MKHRFERYVEEEISARVDAAIVAGYRRIPQDTDAWSDIVARETIAAEPW